LVAGERARVGVGLGCDVGQVSVEVANVLVFCSGIPCDFRRREACRRWCNRDALCGRAFKRVTSRRRVVIACARRLGLAPHGVADVGRRGNLRGDGTAQEHGKVLVAGRVLVHDLPQAGKIIVAEDPHQE
ncbi:unnamed protein product, partial [Pylaiella littoralis]